MRVETDRISGLVDDLFELSRINAGALHITLHNVPLAEVVSDAVAAAAPVARAKRVRLEARRPGTGRSAAASRSWAGCSPTCCSTRSGTRPPTAWCASTAAATRGAGGSRSPTIAAGSRSPTCLGSSTSRSEEPQHAARASEVVASTGGGLGLAIVRGLVDIHDGEVAVANTDGGCRFTVRLPAAV